MPGASDPRFAERLRAALARPRNLRAAHRQIAPRLTYGRHAGPPRHDARAAAVVVLLFEREEEDRVLLTRRHERLSAHAGQISFPGGAVDEGESMQQAALRELHEELGIAADALELLGQLPACHVYASNFVVTPVVAIARELPPLVPNPAEVDEVIELPLSVLRDQSCIADRAITRGRLQFSAPHYLFRTADVWGATAIMLAELGEVLDEVVEGN